MNFFKRKGDIKDNSEMKNGQNIKTADKLHRCLCVCDPQDNWTKKNTLAQTKGHQAFTAIGKWASVIPNTKIHTFESTKQCVYLKLGME